MRSRWLPAWVDAVEYGKFGNAKVTATLFGGMDESLYADFKKGLSGQMAASENTLRTYWPDHDGMEGKIVSVNKSSSSHTSNSSINNNNTNTNNITNKCNRINTNSNKFNKLLISQQMGQ